MNDDTLTKLLPWRPPSWKTSPWHAPRILRYFAKFRAKYCGLCWANGHLRGISRNVMTERSSKLESCDGWPTCTLLLTRHRLGGGRGGGGRIRPPRFFQNNLFIYYCVDMKLGTPLRASIWHRLVQRKSKSAGIFCYRSNFVTSLHAILGRLKVNVWKFTKNSFWVKCKQKWIIHRKARSTKWLSRIF